MVGGSGSKFGLRSTHHLDRRISLVLVISFRTTTTPTLPTTSHTPQKYVGPSAAEVLAQRKQFLNPGIFLYYKDPLMLVEGKMQYARD